MPTPRKPSLSTSLVLIVLLLLVLLCFIPKRPTSSNLPSIHREQEMTDDAGSYTSGVGGGGGNDWELVSLTASTYAAAPGPVLPLLADAHKKTELPPAAASAIFMSQHFNLPAAEVKEESTPVMLPRDDEGATDNLNIPLCPENCVGEQDDSMTRCSDFHKDQSTALDLDGGNLFTDVANAVPLPGGGEGAPVCLAGEEPQLSMLCSSAPPGFDETQPDAAGSDHVRRTSVHHHVSAADAATDGIMGSASLPAHVVQMAVPSSRIPREAQAWWNKTFRFLRSNSSESITFRFIFVAATIVGFAILGQRGKLQLRLEFNVDSENISCGSEPLALGQVKVNMLGGSPIAQG